MKPISRVAALCSWALCLANVAEASLAQSSLDNGTIMVGVNTTFYGGAITYLSLSGSAYNLINNHDRGRQVQQSYYAGQAIDRRSEGQRNNWSPWPWNPIQVGDAYFNSSPVLDHHNDGEEIYVKTHPLLWDMNNELAECHFETWIRLRDNQVVVRNRLTKFRTDDRWEPVARHQELPAVYTIADLPRLYTYAGDDPFTHAPLTRIQNSGPPWAYWGQGGRHEKWAAFVNNQDWGVGVYYQHTQQFIGGFHGSPGGGTFAASTGYISPLRTLTLQKDTIFEYEYVLIVGTLDEIRQQVYQFEGLVYDDPPGIPEVLFSDTFANPGPGDQFVTVTGNGMPPYNESLAGQTGTLAPLTYTIGNNGNQPGKHQILAADQRLTHSSHTAESVRTALSENFQYNRMRIEVDMMLAAGAAPPWASLVLGHDAIASQSGSTNLFTIRLQSNGAIMVKPAGALATDPTLTFPAGTANPNGTMTSFRVDFTNTAWDGSGTLTLNAFVDKHDGAGFRQLDLDPDDFDNRSYIREGGFLNNYITLSSQHGNANHRAKFDNLVITRFLDDSGYAGWAGIHFPDAGPDSHPDADPDGDGIANLLEYAFAGNPNQASRDPIPVTAVADEFLSVRFTRNPNATDLTFRVKASPNLRNWTTIASATGGQPFVNSGASAIEIEGDVVTVSDSEPATGSRRFLAVEIEITDP